MFLHCLQSNSDFKITNHPTPIRQTEYLRLQRVKAGLSRKNMQGVTHRYQRELQILIEMFLLVMNIQRNIGKIISYCV
jgi:hypothetical protein